jgi:hypothetical protein
MKEVAADKASPYKFNAMDAKTRQTTADQAKEVHAYKDKRSQWEAPSATPREVAAPKESDRKAPGDLPKQPVNEVKTAEKAQAGDHADAAREQSAKQDAQPEKVKVTKSPVVVHEQVRDQEQTPPPRPEQPKPDPQAQPKASKADTPDHSKDSKDSDRSDKDKPDSKRN